MTLYKAMALAEDMNCRILHRKTGSILRLSQISNLNDLDKEGWELSDELMPVSFTAEFYGCPEIEGFIHPVTTYVFSGRHKTILPLHTKVRVTMEPLDT